MIAFERDTVVSHRALELGDVADLSALPKALRDRAAALPLGYVGQPRIDVRTDILALRAKGHMPLLACWLGRAPDQQVRIRYQAAAPSQAASAMPSPPWARPSPVHRGDHLTLPVSVGPVRIERQVEALQDARDGQRLFVRSADGDILSVLYAGAPQ